VHGYQDERYVTSFFPWYGMLDLLDTARNLGIFWAPRRSALPVWEASMPLRRLLSWWMGRHNRQFVHSAAVGTAEGCALIIGKGGSGKSTTALACLSAGLLYLGDDYIALEAGIPTVAHSLYSSAKLDEASLKRLPHLRPHVANPSRPAEEKGLLFLHDIFPHRLRASLPVLAILLPVVTGRARTLARPASAGTALAALAPSTLFWLPYAGDAALRAMAAFVRTAPVFTLEVGTDMEQIPAAIAGLLAELSARAGGRVE
jgi:hypothetical protein